MKRWQPISDGVSLERGRFSRRRYIRALETANIALCRENRRLVNLLYRRKGFKTINTKENQ